LAISTADSILASQFAQRKQKVRLGEFRSRRDRHPLGGPERQNPPSPPCYQRIQRQLTRYLAQRPRVRAALPPQMIPCRLVVERRRTCLRRAAPGSGTSLTAETLDEMLRSDGFLLWLW